MKTVQASFLILMVVIILASPTIVSAQDSKSTEDAAKDSVGLVIRIIVRWIFPCLAFIAALYGIGRGLKKGEWDFAVICIVASVVLALLPAVLGKLFSASGSGDISTFWK